MSEGMGERKEVDRSKLPHPLLSTEDPCIPPPNSLLMVGGLFINNIIWSSDGHMEISKNVLLVRIEVLSVCAKTT